MKHLRLHSITPALLLTMALALVGCRDSVHDAVQDKLEEEEDTRNPSGTYLKITVDVSGDRRYGLTRADNPVGGDDGNYQEKGNPNENRVTNATLLLYRGSGINSQDNPIVEYALYAPDMYEVKNSGGTRYTSNVLHYNTILPQGTYHAIVLVNMGDQTKLEGNTLNDVRNTITDTQPYTLAYDNATDKPLGKATTATYFAMTSCNDDEPLFLGGEGGPYNVKEVKSTVERLAARIDFSPGKVTNGEPTLTEAAWVEEKGATVERTEGVQTTEDLPGGYKYVVRTVVDGTAVATDDRFIMTTVTPFNCLNSGTYLIKRVKNTLSSGASETVYQGAEQVDADGNGLNYVVDPWTEQKQTYNDEDHPANLAYRNPLHNASDMLAANRQWPVKDPLDADLSITDDAGRKYYILDYTQENTLPPGHGKEHYATGLQISGYYGHWDDVKKTMTYKPQTYHYYIRHADPNSSTNEALPMKYGVVRNNIYRIHISSVNSLGQIQIVVSEWNRIEVPEIQI